VIAAHFGQATPGRVRDQSRGPSSIGPITPPGRVRIEPVKMPGYDSSEIERLPSAGPLASAAHRPKLKRSVIGEAVCEAQWLSVRLFWVC
jgi:hypothetical protein